MAENNFINLFSLSYDAIHGMKKKDLVDHTENLKGKVVVPIFKDYSTTSLSLQGMCIVS